MGSPNKLVVIGAGLPRTGTLTMKTALQELLGGKCYHMIEFIESGKKFESEFWRNALEGKLEDAQWVDFLERRDFRATVDYPSSFFYKEQMKAFPDAKVILTVRDPTKWHDSVANAIMRSQEIMRKFPQSVLMSLTCGGKDRLQLAYEMSWAVPETQDQCMFSCVKSGYDESARFFNEWVEEVKRAVPPEKLLIFEVKEGWAPLCKFLGVPEPTIPFPRVNDTASMQRKIWWAQVAAWGIVVVLPMLVAAAMIVVLTTTLS